MSAPRRLLAGATYLITRRCSQRQFLLRPGTLTNQIFLYCLAVAAERTGVELHAFVVMSNHWHAVLSDPDVRLPEFLHILHRLVASCMNTSLGRTENFWASGHTNVLQLETAEDVLEKMTYVIANPTAAGLVESPEEWPGLVTTRLCAAHEAPQPNVYFGERGSMPKRTRVVCTVPPALTHLDQTVLAKRLHAMVSAKVRRARSVILGTGRMFVGAQRAQRMQPSRRASTPEPARGRKPALTAKDPGVRAAALERLRAFGRLYRSALAKWQAGNRSVVFPEGTYLMRVLHGARCMAPT